MSSNSVTIDRAYRDELIRRADQKHSHVGFRDCENGGSNDTPIFVPKTEYDALLQTARQYENLKKNLILAGIGESELMVLSQDHGYPMPQPPKMGFSTGSEMSPCIKTQAAFYSNSASHNDRTIPARLTPQLNSHGNRPGRYGTAINNKPADYNNHADADSEDESPYGSTTYGHTVVSENSYSTLNEPVIPDRPLHLRVCRRTIALAGLSPQTTHADVTDVVCGGQLLEIYIRAADHTGLVSFLREEDAVRFYEYAMKRDIYIKHKRVVVKWAERQFHLPGHVARNISAGATRNLIIRRCDRNHTEETIREDLDHIHNLVVISIEFSGNSCYIKTNSVHNAMYARSCMTSRAKYKGSNIEWDSDECERPIPALRKTLEKTKTAPKTAPLIKPSAARTMNRFATLRRDDSDNDLSDNDVNSSSEFPAASSVDGSV